MSEALVRDFLPFFLPQLHPDIDYSKPIIFLSQDIFKIEGGEGKKDDQVLDLLIQVTLKNGTEELVYIHVEIERGNKGNFSERMYNTHRRLRDKFGKNIIGLAIFLGNKIPKSFDRYIFKYYGNEIVYKYNT